MVSLNAETGVPDPDFGNQGVVDLFEGVRNGDDPRYPYPEIGLSAPPLVMNDVIVVGSAHRGGGRPRSKFNTKGDVRGFDVHTGELLWTFHTIPERGEVGYESCRPGSKSLAMQGFGRLFQVIRSWVMSICQRKQRQVMPMVEKGTEIIYSQAAWLPWMSKLVSAYGTTSLFIMTSGTTTSHLPQ